jgi:hypothetical protein
MKVILFCLSFYLIPNFISAFDALNVQPHDQVNDALNIYHPASHLQGFQYQQQAHSHGATYTHRQADTTDNKNNRVAHQHRSRLQRSKYPLQDPPLDTTQVNPIFNDRVVHPKFRPWFETDRNSETQFSFLKTTITGSNSDISSILNDNIQLNQPHLGDGRATTNTTKSSGLLQIFTPNPQFQERISVTDYYFKQKLRELFFGHQHDKYPSPTRSNIKTGLR